MRKFIITTAAATACLLGGTALAGISAEEAARLGGPELTPMGAERAGNADGTIPEWTGGLVEAPANYTPGGKLVDPFPDDQPLFRITAENYTDYEDKLSPGQVAVLKRYPDTFYIPVYQSRRTAVYPQEIYDQVKAGAVNVNLVSGGNGLENLASDTPFPIPASGIEIVWNHVMRYRGGSFQRTYTQIPVQANGAFSPVVFQDQLTYGRYLEGSPPNRLFYYKQTIVGPPRLEGDVLLVHENIDQVKEPRAAWVYNAGQRRVRRAPDVAYDGPGTASDGLRTADDLDMYNGAPDKYDWKLIGKKELYIPYNAYRLRDKAFTYKDVIMPGHLNPEYLRYELHRVWVVEATLKDGERHVYGRRVFYVDEDMWQIAVADQYDNRGELWRVKEAHQIVHYQAKVPWAATTSSYDLISGRHLPIGLDNEVPEYAYVWGYEATEREYTPAALRRSGVR
jgi:hypothetical protein